MARVIKTSPDNIPWVSALRSTLLSKNFPQFTDVARNPTTTGISGDITALYLTAYRLSVQHGLEPYEVAYK